MKVIFLDIDGVLNSEKTALLYGGYPHDFSESNLKLFDFDAIRMVKAAAVAGEYHVVLSSTWRITFTADEISEGLGIAVSDFTPIIGGYNDRGREIDEYLAQNPNITDYVIIDDINVFTSEQQPHCIITDPDNGLTYKDVIMELLPKMGVGSTAFSLALRELREWEDE